ncbi:hypothetical protein C8R43DRAFT_1089034 [Mycena crocata]|nr:hypothetical protein C8R43DRAFT_1089034 [Mycena crocata]
MVMAFLTDVLGWQGSDRGLFGHTNAYYGTVEQQGRLTLHLHALIWIVNALSPQEIRDRLMGNNSAFRRRLVAYLEDSHRAEFFNGSKDAVIKKKGNDDEIDWSGKYRPPTLTLPKAPPPICQETNCTELCAKCNDYRGWLDGYQLEVDDLLVRSNIHTHVLARFPREVFEESAFAADGHVDVRHIEPMINTINPVLTFLNRCNTDVTSMLSGTAVKAVVSYVSDYVSKLSLKSYQMFASVYQVFQRRTFNS